MPKKIGSSRGPHLRTLGPRRPCPGLRWDPVGLDDDDDNDDDADDDDDELNYKQFRTMPYLMCLISCVLCLVYTRTRTHTRTRTAPFLLIAFFVCMAAPWRSSLSLRLRLHDHGLHGCAHVTTAFTNKKLARDKPHAKAFEINPSE